ncbi:MAG TPA: hypothetical protein DCM86_04230 [Verrucomicrobiales bacterium]|nr:hypothetical protein [Verrucomicrobiales bacterium]
MSLTPLSWPEGFRTVHARAVGSYRSGKTSPTGMFTPEEESFLGSIGCTPRELFDLVEDYCDAGEPTPEEAFEMASLRRDYLTKVQGGKVSGRRVSMEELPAKSAEAAGIRWLPRIIVKARAKLRGEMPPELMYGCGGDRPFLASVHFTLPEFLRLVWEKGEDTDAIVDAVRARAGRR